MHHKFFLTITLLILSFLFGCAGWRTNEKMGNANSNGINQPSGEVKDSVRIIKMTAKKFEYDPAIITVDQGDKVRLEITSKDVTHGFAIKEYNIDRTLEPGKTQIVEFTADKAGQFTYRCSVFCGMGHLGMKGKLIVQKK